jgi:hypothetical protein
VTATDPTVRVCPRCGSAAGPEEFCAGCGLHLALLAELPTWQEWRAGGAARDGAPTRKPASLKPLLHPTETSRLVLATIAALAPPVIVVIAVIARGAAIELVALAAAIAFFAGSIWIGLQIYRARMLGHTVKVDPTSLPELNALIEDVRDTLQYHERVDVYVADKGSQPIVTTSYLGTRIIVIEGGLVAELMEPPKRAQLTFLFGRAIGALRAKHMRLDLLVVLLNAFNVLRYPSLFIVPWYRATTYSGDQIGMMCCADPEAALEATRRLLVGKEIAAQMHVADVLPQVNLVQRRWLPRLAQLFLAEPHTTNRYANLLCFARYHDPDAWEHLRNSVDAEAVRQFDAVWARSPYRHRAV